MKDESAAFLKTAQRAAAVAGRILLGHFRQEPSTPLTVKGKNDFATAADREAEAAIVAVIGERFPGHRILAEEGGGHAQAGCPVWVVDPLDGTSNFVAGIPIFSISIALVAEGRPQLGIVYDPVHEEWFIARRGGGATLNGRPIRVGGLPGLDGALGATGFPFRRHHLIAPYLRAFAEILARCQDMRRCGSAALDLAFVACGRCDFFWEAHLQPWDFCAGRLLVEEAGGCISDFSGQVPALAAGGIIAANRAIFPALRELIGAQFPPPPGAGGCPADADVVGK